MALEFYNSLTKKVEPFVPLDPDNKTVGLYTCGPTVYSYVTVGNWRTYTLGDLIARTLRYEGYKANYYMNLTDVGHLTGDNEGDADTGEDRMEKAKRKEGKNAWEIAEFYTKDFENGYKKLNLTAPNAFLKATEHIPEQITLVQKLLNNGFAYQIGDGIYFDTAAYEAKGYRYGELSNLDHIKAGARVELNPEKKDIRDFALWKFSPSNEKRDMEWESPWGVGFPGWHIECSAMSMQCLGEQFDIHVGGEDLKSTHHPNEIAQSQGATGKVPFVQCWIHGAFLLVDGGRMGKSLGNAYTIQDIEAKGINPLALRFFYLGSHYRSQLNFTWEALEGAQAALKRIYAHYLELPPGGIVNEKYRAIFASRIEDDLNTPLALATMWELVKDADIPSVDKKATLLDFDRVLGLGLAELKREDIPAEITALAHAREQARQEKDWTCSDELRGEIESQGYTVKDTDNGPVVEKK